MAEEPSAKRACVRKVIAVGDVFPSVNVHVSFPPSVVDLSEALKAKGIDEVIVYCINDGAVMDAWAKDQGVGKDNEGSLVNFLADTHGELTDPLGFRMCHDGPYGVLGGHRCKRTALVVDDLKVQVVKIAEYEDDPAGDDKPDCTLATALLKDLDAL